MYQSVSAAYRVWIHPDHEFKRREYVESAQGPEAAKPLTEYLNARLQPTDSVHGDWGSEPGPEVPRLDPHRLQEPQNAPVEGTSLDDITPTPGRPLVLDG